MLKDGDSVFMHPVGTAPGYQLYYLWVMAGPHGRNLIPRDNPNLSLLHNVPLLLK